MNGSHRCRFIQYTVSFTHQLFRLKVQNTSLLYVVYVCVCECATCVCFDMFHTRNLFFLMFIFIHNVVPLLYFIAALFVVCLFGSIKSMQYVYMHTVALIVRR